MNWRLLLGLIGLVQAPALLAHSTDAIAISPSPTLLALAGTVMLLAVKAVKLGPVRRCLLQRTPILTLAGAVGAILALTQLPPGATDWMVTTQTIVLVLYSASLFDLGHKDQEEALRKELLNEVASKTATLEDKNRQLRSAQRALRIANLELKTLSFTDALTGAFNRLYFDRQFLTEWQRARREKEPLSMILVDIDHFKELNDDNGHLVGDNALKFVTKLLKKGFQRGSDVVCRYGGEEFVILLPNTPPAQAMIRAEKVRNAIEMTPFIYDDKVLPITASFGVGGLVPKPGHEPLGLLHATDQALYHVKRNGRNGCHQAELIEQVTPKGATGKISERLDTEAASETAEQNSDSELIA
ncbi:GGDEF domain-containing protein [Pseudomaricurvus alkylphenolicus]|uniref:GGDEF domain-containing protein n=1 Tax=Pseudomaricurvus alkylphenolicus TaxID=1306991 RepID=UPI00142203B5|nr:GGDEF domain-containing protein [Pseudomaricurvus alkylphenolicus]NIB44535.1 GGDEF domain-containing protein [Pseudomaricurvus alkylphenolicus]